MQLIFNINKNLSKFHNTISDVIVNPASSITLSEHKQKLLVSTHAKVTDIDDSQLDKYYQEHINKSSSPMNNKQNIHTEKAPKALGSYSQAVKIGTIVYISGQISLIPETMTLDDNSFKDQARRCFENLKAIAEAASGSLSNAVKVTIYLTDINDFSEVDDVMAAYFDRPYPARAAVVVKELPKGASVEIDAILELE